MPSEGVIRWLADVMVREPIRHRRSSRHDAAAAMTPPAIQAIVVRMATVLRQRAARLDSAERSSLERNSLSSLAHRAVSSSWATLAVKAQSMTEWPSPGTSC